MVSMYCGDEVAAVVADIGTLNSKFGFAGQDSPRGVFRTYAGIVHENGSQRKLYGDSKIRLLNHEMDVVSPFANESINWDSIELLLRYGIEDNLQVQAKEFPLFLTESKFHNNERKEKLLELVFEGLNSPAMYIMNDCALSTFCSGRATSLAVDFGASSIRITPIVDGYTLRKAMIECNKGGYYLDEKIKSVLLSSGINIRPFYEYQTFFQEKLKKQSFKDFHTYEVIRDVKQWMSIILPSNSIDEAGSSRIQRISPYELPDGTIIYPTNELCSFPCATLFTSTKDLSSTKRPQFCNQLPPFAQPYDINIEESSLQQLIYLSVASCDIDVRKDLLANVLLVGGGSLIEGLGNRLQDELSKVFPTSYKMKVITSLLPVERQYSAWIGGSILSICGTFQQCWISRREYEENGPGYHRTKCNN